MDHAIAIQTLLDRTAIVDVVARYATSIDRRQWDTFGSCFTDQLAYKFPYANGWLALGRDDLVRLCARLFARFDATQHISANHQITVSGDEATCISTLNATHYIADAAGGPHQRQIGYYEYHLVRADSWRIDRLELVVSWEDGNQDIFIRSLSEAGIADELRAIVDARGDG